MKFILYSSFLLLLAPCNGPKQTTASNPENTSDKIKTIVIGYQKTVCFGKCPAFTMTINGQNNKVTYQGDSNVNKIGTYEKSISDEDLARLSDAFEKYKFFELKDEYNGEMTDLPSKYISYSFDGKSKKVKDRYNAPVELRELEKLLDAIADSEGWEKIKDKDPE
jgi:hypothetical protein